MIPLPGVALVGVMAVEAGCAAQRGEVVIAVDGIPAAPFVGPGADLGYWRLVD